MTRVGLIGLGAMGRNHLRVLSDLEGVELAAICDQDVRLLESAGRKHSVPTYRTWDEMLDRERLDAAVVAVPTGFHCQVGLAALDPPVLPEAQPNARSTTAANATHTGRASSLSLYISGFANHHRCPSGSRAPYSRCP